MNVLLRAPSLVDAAGAGGRRNGLRLRLTVVSAILAALLVPAGALAQSTAVIDFEGLAAGKIVNEVASGAGVSGAAVSGSVAVFGDSADPDVSSNAAIVYDASCGGGGPAACSGGETDMHAPGLGNVLIIGRELVDSNGDGIVDVPDVYNGGGDYRFDFSRFGPGTVTVASLDLLDVDAGATGSVKLFAGGALISTVPFSGAGNNAVTSVSIGISGVDRMEVNLLESGGIDNIRLQVGSPPTPPPPPPPTPPPAPPAPPPPPVTPPPPPGGGGNQPTAVCARLTMSRTAVVVGLRTTVRVRVIDTNGAPMRGIRVTARGAGARTAASTGTAGYARLALRPRIAGVIRLRAAGSTRCLARIRAASAFKPPALTG